MAPVQTRKRRIEDEVRPKKKVKKVKRQNAYHSSSEDEADGAFKASDVPRSRPKHVLKVSQPKSILKAAAQQPAPDSDADEDEEERDKLEENTALNGLPLAEMVSEEDDEDDNDEPDLDGMPDDDPDSESASDVASASEASVTSSQAARNKKKRNDPTAFATSISKILDTKLSTAKRSEPVLSRSKSASDANKQLADSKLEQKARAQIRAEKRNAAEKGRVKDVLGLKTDGVDTGALLETERRLKKTAQRGVVKLFNAVRAAQVKAEETMKQAREEGVVGMQKRDERMNEMSKQGFLDLISSGGATKAAMASS